MRAGPVEEILRVQIVVAQIFVEHAVDLVGAGLGGEVDLRAGAASELGGVGAGLHLEFLDGFGGDRDGVLVDRQIVVVHAVEQEVIGLFARAVDGDRPALGLVLRTFHALIRAGDQQVQLQEIPAVQRQLGDFLVIDDIADGGRIGTSLRAPRPPPRRSPPHRRASARRRCGADRPPATRCRCARSF